MNNFPEDNNRKFIDFLRQNYPPIPPSFNEEERLMQKIDKHALRHIKCPYGLLFALPSAMVTGAFLTLNNVDVKLDLISTAKENKEIETFLIHSWTNSWEYRHVEMAGEFDDYLFNPAADNSKTLSLSAQ